MTTDSNVNVPATDNATDNATAKRQRKAKASASDLPVARAATDSNVKAAGKHDWCGAPHHVAANGMRYMVPGKVTQAAANAATVCGARPGTNVWLALALYFTARVQGGKAKGGATQAMVSALCNGPQLNKARAIVARGLATELRHKAPCPITGRVVEYYGLKLAATAAKPRKAATKGNKRK